jgi:Asp-tRNA(Asn)/Glu-tRNA(Gln) amidotransferase A subunit family amidase
MSSELIELTVAQATERIRAGEIAGEEYFGAYREAAAGDPFNAFLWKAEEPGEAADGSLSGIPVAVKDIFCTEAVPTTAGSRILEGYRPPYTATAVRNLRDAGASVLGKVNMDEFAMGSRTRTPPTVRSSTHGTAGAFPEARRVDRRRRSPAVSHRARSEPTPGARSASRRPCAGSSA